VVQTVPLELRQRFKAVSLDASSAAAVADAVRQHGITHVFNAVDPRFVMPIFEGAAKAGAAYLIWPCRSRRRIQSCRINSRA